MSSERYPIEVLDEDKDDGTIVENLATLGSHVIGHRITKAERQRREDKCNVLVLTLDDGTQVELADTGVGSTDGYTSLDAFFLDPASGDHIITGVGSTDGYTVWHIYADWGDILRLELGWSRGNPFYYGYGFDINVVALPPSSDDCLPVRLVDRTRPPQAATQPALPHPQPTPPDTRKGLHPR